MYRVQKSELKGGFLIKKVAAIVAEGIVLLLGAATVYYPIVRLIQQKEIDRSVMVGGVVFLIIAICNLKKCIYYVSTPYLCVPEVSRYIKRKQLRCMIEEEEFSYGEENHIAGLMRVFVSENWIYIEGIYLPRRMILGMWQFYTGPAGPARTSKIVFQLCTGKKIVVDTHQFLQVMHYGIRSHMYDFLERHIIGEKIAGRFECDDNYKLWCNKLKKEFKQYINKGGKIEDIITGKNEWKQQEFISKVPSYCRYEKGIDKLPDISNEEWYLQLKKIRF